jgi:hypothetical protein
MSKWTLRAQARKFYPHSRNMQCQWIRVTARLLQTGKHALQTGGWRRI